MRNYVIFVFLVFLSACKIESKEQEKNSKNSSIKATEKTSSDSRSIGDTIAKQMMKMFEMEGETFHDMMKTDSLETAIMKTFSAESLTQILKESNLSDAEIARLLSKMGALKTQPTPVENKKREKDSSLQRMQDLFGELTSVLSASGSEQQVKELEAMMEKENIKGQLEGLETTPTASKVSNLREILGTDEPSFIEENLTSYSLYGNKEKREALQKLRVSSKEEGEKILMDYFKVSNKELQLLKSMPLRKEIPSETVAINLLATKIPKNIQTYTNSGKTSPKFKSLTSYFFQEQEGRAKTFLQYSAQAREKFYSDNPGWYGENSKTGITYIDSRHQYIYLPLGTLSFADRVISHQLGNPQGSHTKGSIGPPDFATERFDKPDPKICNLGTSGILTLEFTDNAISNVEGPDLYIFEMGAIEPTNLEISKDGKNWINVGKIEGGTAKVDIAAFVKPGETYTYVRLTDLKTRSELPGADVDAVAAIGGAVRMNLDSAVLFDTGKSLLKDTAASELEKLLNAIKEISGGSIIVEGHTDNVGDSKSNQALSEKRAKEVALFLEKNLSDRYLLQTNGYGENRPLAPNDSEENKQKNRRVEILVIPGKNK